MPERRTALVTGSGKNIGRATALKFADQGLNVVVHGLKDSAACEAVAEEVRRRGVRAKVLMGDLGSASEVRRIADAALAEFGTIDVLVTNAAIRPHKAFLDLKEADLRSLMSTNFESCVLLAQAFLPGMIKKKWGRIVLFAGRMAIRGVPGNAALSASKHAVWGLGKALAKEFGARGITTNVVSPGSIDTVKEGEDLTEKRKKDAAEIPIGRIGTSEEIAAVAAFLGSVEAGFVNGQMIGANGGIET